MTTQERIKKILSNAGGRYNETWLAKKLGTKQNTLNYNLNHAVRFPEQLKEDIYEIFLREGLIKNRDDECTQFNSLTLDVISNAAMDLNKLVTRTKAAINNNEIDERERKELISIIGDMKINLVKPLDDMLELLKFNE